jgi:hypothetical protein
MYFAYLYPYTYSELRCWLSRQPPALVPSLLCRSHGGVDVPAIFWDADELRCVTIASLLTPIKGPKERKKPLIVVAARHHPGESIASYAMEAFMGTLFGNSESGDKLLARFSFLIVPMINVDGVICGYYRPSLTGYDMNRSWISPTRKRNPVEFAIVNLLDKLVKRRPLLFLLDYHGHSTQCNAFVYGVDNIVVPFSDLQTIFVRLMARNTSVFNENGGGLLPPDAYAGTMRVALHHRYQIPFAFTLEMSFGGRDIGPNGGSQLTPNDYREVGAATVVSMATMMLEQIPLGTIVANYVSPRLRRVRADFSD